MMFLFVCFFVVCGYGLVCVVLCGIFEFLGLSMW